MNLNNLTDAFTPDGGSSASKNVLAGDIELKGTIKFFGTPAEEEVGGKIYMVR